MNMASLPHKPNSGFFGKNNRKAQPNSPDYTGKVSIGDDTLATLNAMKASGKAMVLYLSGWKRTPQAGGEQYISLSVGPPMAERSGFVQAQPQSKPQAASKAEDEDIPF